MRSELRDADLKRLQATLTRDLIYPLYALNCKSFNDARRIPRLEFDVSESEDINSFADGLNKLVDIGFKIPAQWAHDKLQVPIAADDEPVLERKTTPGNDRTFIRSTQTSSENSGVKCHS